MRFIFIYYVFGDSATLSFVPHCILLPRSLSGTLVTLPPPSMKNFNIRNTRVKIDVAAIEWPANATALVYEKDDYGDSGTLVVCSTTDPDESKEGAEASEIRFKCGRDQVIGTSSAWRVIYT